MLCVGQYKYPGSTPVLLSLDLTFTPVQGSSGSSLGAILGCYPHPPLCVCPCQPGMVDRMHVTPLLADHWSCGDMLSLAALCSGWLQSSSLSGVSCLIQSAPLPIFPCGTVCGLFPILLSQVTVSLSTMCKVASGHTLHPLYPLATGYLPQSFTASGNGYCYGSNSFIILYCVVQHSKCVLFKYYKEVYSEPIIT